MKTKLTLIALIYFASTGVAFGELKMGAWKLENKYRNFPWKADAVISSSAEGETKLTEVDGNGKALSHLKLEKRAVNLGILIDNSTACDAKDLEPQLNELLGHLKKEANAKSMVSIMSYHSDTMQILQKQKEVASLEDIDVKCTGKSLSASFEKPLLMMLQSMPKSSQGTYFWVLTSGNIKLSEAGLKIIRESGAEVNVVLYNKILEKMIRPLLDRYNSQAGNDIFSLSLFQSKALPQRWVSIYSEEVPAKENPVFLKVTDGKDQQLTKTKVMLPQGTEKNALVTFLIKLFLAVIVCALVITLLVKYYRVKTCKECGRRTRFGEKFCWFCLPKGTPYLIGRHMGQNRNKHGKWDVVPLCEEITALGSKKAKTLIQRVKLNETDVGYQVIPSQKSEVFFNGRKTKSPVFIGSGDEILIDGMPLYFYSKRRNHE